MTTDSLDKATDDSPQPVPAKPAPILGNPALWRLVPPVPDGQRQGVAGYRWVEEYPDVVELAERLAWLSAFKPAATGSTREERPHERNFGWPSPELSRPIDFTQFNPTLLYR